jgi:hypothetical protein
MATIEDTLVTLVQTGVLSINERIYPYTLPEGTSLNSGSSALPAIVYQMVSDFELNEAPVAFPVYQLTVYGRTTAEAKATAAELKYVLNRYKGGYIFQVAYRAARDLRDPDTGLVAIPMDFRIAWNTEGGD